MNPGLKQVKTMKIYETWGSEMDELSKKLGLYNGERVDHQN